MTEVLIVVAVVVVLAVVQLRRRGSRLQRADNAPIGRRHRTGRRSDDR